MILKTTRTEQHVIKKHHPKWKVIDDYCFYSKNLYNYANYIIRQEFITNKRWIRYRDLDKMIHASEPYKQLMSQASQCTLQVLDRNWKSFFVSIKDWKKNPDKYLGMPKLPKYKPKDGRFPWFIKNNQSRIIDGYLTFQMRCFDGFKFKTHCDGRLIAVRFIPHSNYYMLEIVYEVDVSDVSDMYSKQIASIDLGVNNFVTLTNNIGKQPIIINGKGIKSINQFYNKQKAKIQSELMIRNNKHWSKKLDVLNFKRTMKIKNFTHNASRKIIHFCIENNIDTLVCGYNKMWKQETNMSKTSNQNFTYIPYDMFIKQLEYKCQNEGLKFILTEESYTSGTSFLDGELPCKENYDKSRRVKRGLFQSGQGLINSDVNGSLQILMKVFPDAFSYGIKGVLTPTIINVVKTA